MWCVLSHVGLDAANQNKTYGHLYELVNYRTIAILPLPGSFAIHFTYFDGDGIFGSLQGTSQTEILRQNIITLNHHLQLAIQYVVCIFSSLLL